MAFGHLPKVREGRAWHLHRLLLPEALAAKSWIASEHCPEHKWGVYPLDTDTTDQ